MFGDGYIAQHVNAYIKCEYKDQMFRLYVTDALKYLTENTANRNGGTKLTKRYIDLVDPKEPEEPKSPDEIIDEVTKNAGLEVIE